MDASPERTSSTPSQLPAVMRRKLSDLFTPDEISRLTARSDLRGGWAVLSTWGVIAACFAVLTIWPHPLTFILAVVILGGRQLALAILAHEAAHRTLFKTPILNDTVADWFCARPIWNDVPRYREHHLRHHTHTGTDRDPDMSLVRPLPVTRRSLVKKFFRDLSGQTGVRRMAAQFLMDIGVFRYTVAAEVERLPRDGRSVRDYVRTGFRNLGGFVLAQFAIAGVLAACGALWTYLAWAVAYLTTFSLYIRIRSMAEHACTEDSPDMFRNTRSTRAGFIARWTVAPWSVNHHLEHHVMASVPYFQLRRMHALMRERGAAPVSPGYLDVLALVSSVPPRNRRET
ncbi:MAG: fatty acid desaturase family protein [Panacagrimonas sp.]